MSWLFFAILARFLWGITNIVDQFMVRWVPEQSAATVIIIENFVMLPVLLVLMALGVAYPAGPATVLWLLFGALINTCALVPYFLALKDDHAYNAVPLMELTPVFLTLLAWLIFHDTLSTTQLLGAALVIGGGFLFAWDFKHGRIRLKTAFLMAASSLFWAVYQLVLRAVAPHESALSIMLAVSSGYVLMSIVLFAVLPRQRRLVVKTIRDSKGIVVAIAFGEETLAFIANLALIIAFAQAPKAGQVAALSSTQAIFVLGISMLLGLLLPKRYPRLAWDWGMKIKCLLLVVIAGGVVLLKSP